MIKGKTENLPANSEKPIIHVNRSEALFFKESGECDHKGEKTIFGQIYQGLISNGNFSSMQKNYQDDRAWESKFVGEHSIDAGGPYRETFTNFCEELQSAHLPLLIETANNRGNHGLFRECYTINPSSTTPSHIGMYKFLGKLLGLAFRAGQVMDLNLTPLFYKQLM